MEFLKSPLRVAFVVALFVLAFTSSGNAQIRQNKLYIDNGSGTFLELVGTSLTGSTNRTIDFGNPQSDASVALTTGTPASGDILYWDNINKVWARLPVGTGVLQAGSTPGYGKVDLSSTSYVTGQLGTANGGTGTTSLSSLATALKPYAANILPVNAAGVLTNDGLGGLTWAVGAGTGTVTGITAGTGLTGGTINSSGTIALDLTSANAWTGAQTFEKDNIKTTFTDGTLLNNTQVSDATNTVQYSPSLELDAHAWNTTSSADNLEQSRLTLIPTSGATTGATLTWQMANNGGAYSNVMSLSSNGNLTATSFTANSFTGSGAGLTNIPAGQITGTLPAGATWNGNVIGATYGGLGADLHASAVGSVIYYDGAKFVALPPDAVVGKVLASNGTGAAPSWQSVTGASLSANNTFTGADVFAPTSAGVALSVQAASSGSNDIFDVTNNGGSTKYLSVSSTGVVTIPTLTSTSLTTQDGASGFTIRNVADNTKKAQFDASAITTGNTRTYTFPDANGTLALVGLSQTFTGAQTIAPTGSGVTGLTVQATSGGGSADIVDVTGNGGSPNYLSVNSSGVLNLRQSGIGTTYTADPVLSNTTVATSGVPVQQSPSLEFDAHGYNTGAATDTMYSSRVTLVPNSGNPVTAAMNWDFRNGQSTGSWINAMNLTDTMSTTVKSTTLKLGSTGSTKKVGRVAFADGSSTNLGALQTGTLTGARAWSLPDASGTIALVGTTQNSSANFSSLGINIGASSPSTTLEVNGDFATRATTNSTFTGGELDATGTSEIRLTGPTSNFTISGISGGACGKKLRIFNATGNIMTIADHNSSSTRTSTATNRIVTTAGGDITLKPNVNTGDDAPANDGSSIDLVYDCSLNRWVAKGVQAVSVGGQVPNGIATYLRTGDATTITTTATNGVNTNVGADNVLQFTMGANQTYEIRGTIIFNITGSGTTSLDFGVQVPGTGASLVVPFEAYALGGTFKLEGAYVLNSPGNGVKTSYANSAENFSPDKNDCTIVYDGFVTSGSSAGTCALLFNLVNGSSLTIKGGSYLITTRIK